MADSSLSYGSYEHHLDSVKKRKKAIKTRKEAQVIANTPEENNPHFVASLLESLSKCTNFEEYYAELRKRERRLGNSLQTLLANKANQKTIFMNLSQQPCPDYDMHYTMKIVFETIFEQYSRIFNSHYELQKPKQWSNKLLMVYVNELSTLESVNQSFTSNTIEIEKLDKNLESFDPRAKMKEYLEQWGLNVWPSPMKASEIIPRSWSMCVSKMQQIMGQEWKPPRKLKIKSKKSSNSSASASSFPEVEAFEPSNTPSSSTKDADSQSTQTGTEHSQVPLEEADDSQSLQAFISHRSFFLALYLYFTINPVFFLKNSYEVLESLKSNTSKDLISDLLHTLMNQRFKEMGLTNSNSMESTHGAFEKFKAEVEGVPQDKCGNQECKTAQSSPSNSLKLCGGCKNIKYCTPECQQEHWKTHKSACKQSR